MCAAGQLYVYMGEEWFTKKASWLARVDVCFLTIAVINQSFILFDLIEFCVKHKHICVNIFLQLLIAS